MMTDEEIEEAVEVAEDLIQRANTYGSLDVPTDFRDRAIYVKSAWVLARKVLAADPSAAPWKAALMNEARRALGLPQDWLSHAMPEA